MLVFLAVLMQHLPAVKSEAMQAYCICTYAYMLTAAIVRGTDQEYHASYKILRSEQNI